MRGENGVRREEAGECLRALVVNSHRVLSLLSPLSALRLRQTNCFSLSLCRFVLLSSLNLDWIGHWRVGAQLLLTNHCMLLRAPLMLIFPLGATVQRERARPLPSVRNI